MAGKIKFRVKECLKRRWDISKKALQNLLRLFPAQWKWGDYFGQFTTNLNPWRPTILLDILGRGHLRQKHLNSGEKVASHKILSNQGALHNSLSPLLCFILDEITKCSWVKMPANITMLLWWVFSFGGMDINRRASKRGQATTGIWTCFCGCGFRLWSRRGFPASQERTWITGLQGERGMVSLHFLVVSIPIHPQKEGWGCAGAVHQTQVNITNEPKPHFSDHFTNLQK